MNNVVNIPDRDPPDRAGIEAEARAWLVQLDGGAPTPEELREFREWLERSPFHREAFTRAASAWNELDTLSTILETADRTSTPGLSAGGGVSRMFGAAFSRPALTCLTVIIGLSILLAGYFNAPEYFRQQAFTAAYSTAVGETRSVKLPDGSVIRLNTGSRIEIGYNSETRNIHLSEGEAWFDVFHDPDHPFIVYAGKVAVRAVGTAFSVRIYDNKVDLTVTDGRVEAASLEQPVFSLARITPGSLDRTISRVPLAEGQHVVFEEEIELVQRIAPERIEKKLSWRDGMLIFDNDPLEDVVSEINRYTPMKIVISDSAIRDMRFGGYFRAGDITSILATFEENFDIRVEKINPDLIYLSRRRGRD